MAVGKVERRPAEKYGKEKIRKGVCGGGGGGGKVKSRWFQFSRLIWHSCLVRET